MARKTTKVNVKILEPDDETNSGNPNVLYESPRDHYVYSPEKITINEVAIIWESIVKCTASNLLNKANKEKWVKQRKKFWAKAADKADARMATKASKQIVDANLRHIGMGKALQGTAAKVLKTSIETMTENPEDLKPGEGLRVSTTMAKAGVDIERKGLGISDSLVHVANVREIVGKVLGVIARHVREPDILQSIIFDLQALEQEEHERMEKEVLMLSEPDEGLE